MQRPRLTAVTGWARPAYLIGLLLIVCILGAAGAVAAASPDAEADRSQLSVLVSRFEEPLVATGQTSLEEDDALTQAITAYNQRAAVDDVQPLESFLAAHPISAWRLSLLTNLGLSYYHYGYFSKAIDAFELAWKEGQTATELHAKALADRAAGELLRMHARLGHSERLAALLDELRERGLTGSATEMRDGAKEGLWVMRNEPGVAYLCGPLALKNLLLARGVPASAVAFLDAYRSGPHGVTLAEVGRLAGQAKLP